MTIKEEIANGKFHQSKRKDVGAWVMGTTIYQVGLHVREMGKVQAAEYTLKVDVHAVFIPRHLRTWLNTKPGDWSHGA